MVGDVEVAEGAGAEAADAVEVVCFAGDPLDFGEDREALAFGAELDHAFEEAVFFVFFPFFVAGLGRARSDEDVPGGVGGEFPGPLDFQGAERFARGRVEPQHFAFAGVGRERDVEVAAVRVHGEGAEAVFGARHFDLGLVGAGGGEAQDALARGDQQVPGGVDRERADVVGAERAFAGERFSAFVFGGGGAEVRAGALVDFAADHPEEMAAGAELLDAGDTFTSGHFGDVEVAFGADGDPAVVAERLAGPGAFRARPAARFGGAGLEAGGGGGAVVAGTGFEGGFGIAFAERRGAVFGAQLFDIRAGQGAAEGDDVNEGGGGLGVAERLFDGDFAAGAADRRQGVQGGLHFFPGGVEGQVRGFRSFEAELEGPRAGADPHFLGLVDRPRRHVPAEGRDEFPPGGELVDAVVALAPSR